MKHGSKWSFWIGGFALFSMFFGAGNLVYPLMLGGASGTQNLPAVAGMFVTAVAFPLLGLIAMMLFGGDHKSFFGRLGRGPGWIVYFLVQVVLGPVGSIPRLFTVAYATLQPYLPEISLGLFSLLACGLIFGLTLKRQKIVDLLGSILTPLLLLSLGLIIALGLWHHPEPQVVAISAAKSFGEGLKMGYNTLDLIASLLFAKLILSQFQRDTEGMEPNKARKEVMKRFVKASVLAAGLLGLTYAGMSFIASYYVPVIGEMSPEHLLNAISVATVGPYGALVASVAVAMACLTTAIALVAIFSDYVQKDLLRDKVGRILPMVITLGVSWLLANLGFMGIKNLLAPILEVFYPGLIVLSALNLVHKLYEFRPVKVPVVATVGVTLGAALL